MAGPSSPKPSTGLEKTVLADTVVKEPDSKHAPSVAQKLSDVSTEVRSQAAAALDLNAEVIKLPEITRLQAILGIEQSFQVTHLPENLINFSITIPRMKLVFVTNLLRDLGLRSAANFFGNPSDELAVLSYICPDFGNVWEAHNRLIKAGVSAHIALADRTSVVLKTPGAPLITWDSHLYDDDPTDPARSIFESVNDKGGRKTLPEIQGTRISAFDSALATKKSLSSAQKEQIKLPRTGRCSYMMIDQTQLIPSKTNDKTFNRFLNDLLFMIKTGYIDVTSYNGYLVLIATSGKSGGSLALTARRIHQAHPDIRFLLGEGNVRLIGGYQYEIEGGFPKIEDRHSFRVLTQKHEHARIFATRGFRDLMNDPSYRDSSICEVKVRPADEEDKWFVVTDITPKGKYRPGGPDQFIGLENELELFKKFMAKNRTGIVVIRGPAAIGKSRFVAEASHDLPGFIDITLDEMGHKAPGFQLMTLAEQLEKFIAASPELGLLPEARKLQDFNGKSQSERLNIVGVRSGATVVVDLCFAILKELNVGGIPLSLDDFHLADFHSLPFLVELLAKYACEKGIVIVILREGEAYEPAVITDLEARIKAVGGKTLRMGMTGLDFTNPKISKPYAFHCIPRERREKEGIKDIGEWYRTVGAKAGRSPGAMDELMRMASSAEESHVDPSTGIFVVPQCVLDRMPVIRKGSDLETTYITRIEKLEEPARQLLVCIAVMGGSADLEQIGTILSKVLRLTDSGNGENSESLVRKLVDGMFITSCERSADGPPIFKCLDEPMRAAALRFLPESPDRFITWNSLPALLFKHFRDDPNMHPWIKFNIAARVALSNYPPPSDVGHFFWRDFIGSANECFDLAQKMKASDMAYAIARAVCDAAQVEGGTSFARESCRDLATKLVSQPTEMHLLIIKAFTEMAQSAVTLSRYDDINEAALLLGAMKTQNPRLVDMTPVALAEFESAYIRGGIADGSLDENYDALDECNLSPEFAAIAEIKWHVRHERFDEALKVYGKRGPSINALNAEHKRQHQTPHPEYVEMVRLVGKIKTERIFADLRRTFDDEAMHPGILSPEQAEALLEIAEELEGFENTAENFPTAFTPHRRLGLLDQFALVNAYLGKTGQADKSLTESWRQADQLGLNVQGARLAYFHAAMLLCEAVCTVIKKPEKGDPRGEIEKNRIFLTDKLEAAAETLVIRGANSLARIRDKNSFYHMAIPVERIAVSGLMCFRYRNELAGEISEGRRAEITRELAPHISAAFEHWKTLNENLDKILAPSAEVKLSQGEIAYYSSYIAFVFEAASKLKIPLAVSFDQYPLMTEEALRAAKSMAYQKKDGGMGIIGIKKEALIYLQGLKGY